MAAVALAACGDDGKSSTERLHHLEIGALVPLSGDLSEYGPVGRAGAEAALSVVEEATGRLADETTVNVRHADTHTDEEIAIETARHVISGGASCLVGAWSSENTIAVGEKVSVEQEVPLVSPASTSPRITGLADEGFVFRTAPSDEHQGELLAEVAEEQLGGTGGEVALAGPDDPYAQDLLAVFEAAWEKKAGRTRTPVLFDPSQRDFGEEAEELVRGDPAGYLVVAYPGTYARLGEALVATGSFDARRLVVPDGLAAESVADIGAPRDALVGARGTRPALPDEPLAAAFEEQLDEPQERLPWAGYAFDAEMLCVLAAVAAGSNEGHAIRDELRPVSAPPGKRYSFEELPAAIAALRRGEDIDYEGVSGPIDFDDAGNAAGVTYEVFTYSNDGSLEVERTVDESEIG